MINKYFIAVFTNEVKDYCDETFFNSLYALSKGEQVVVIDNSGDSAYYEKLKESFIINGYDNFNIYHLDVPEQPKESRFQRNVCDSVNLLRDIFLLQTTLPYFLIVESDVYSEIDLLSKFDTSIDYLETNQPDWGIIGGLYYRGFHNYNFDTSLITVERVSHCLSGCTVYKRELINKFTFRYDPENLGPFPDAWISYDSNREYTLWNEHRIKCDHMHNSLNGLRVR